MLARCFLLFFIIFFPFWVAAQSQEMYDAPQRERSLKVAQSLENQAKVEQVKIAKMAKKYNWPLRQVFSDGSVMILSGVSETRQPLYEATHSNRGAAQTTRTDALFEGGDLGLNLTGGSTEMREKLAVWDGGKVLNTHVELAGRVRQADNASTTDDHATHVSGTMVATGINPRARGMANQTALLAYDFGSDQTEMAAAAANLLVSNHSYGPASGWRYNADRAGTDANLKWEWYGDTSISATEEYRFGFYDSRSRDWDRIAYNSPNYLIVKSAGNDHGDNGPTGGAAYFLGNSSRTSKTPRANQNGYDQIATNGTAKNTLTVGAVSILSNGYNQISDPRISSFSSWGPTDDGRIKPDIMGVGVNVLSTISTNNNAYTSLNGTSMSSPNVAGSVFLLQELHQNLQQRFMRSSTLKGLILHSADDAGNPGPDYQYGWGLLNNRRAAEVLLNRDQSHLLNERTLLPNETYTLPVTASGRGKLVITICWTDPEALATTANASNLNNRNPKLINDLDLRVSDGTTETLPWILNPDQPNQNATRGDNFRDNVEQIIIPNAVPGKTYTISVRHKGTLTNARQDYTLIVSGIGGKTYCESRANSNADSKITRVVFGSINQAANAGCQNYSDFMTVSAAVSSGQTLPLEVSVGSCGGDFTKIIKTFADWNNDGDFDDPNELLATSEPINGNGIFRANVATPVGLTAGNSTRLRVVCVETNNAAEVLACGTFGKGETQEFLLNFVRPALDVSLSALLSPSNNVCGNQVNSVTLRVRNLGSQAVVNVPVSVAISETNGRQVGSFVGSLTQNLAAFGETTFSVNNPILSQLQPNTTYTFICRTNLANDQDSSNNALRQTITTAPTTTAPVATATYCDNDPLALLTKGNGVPFWYDAPAVGNLLAIGNPANTSIKQPDGVFYAAFNDFSGSIGPATKTAFGGGTYSGQFGPSPLFRAEAPLLLESARLYIANAGKLTFSVLTLDGAFVSSTTLDVSPTRNANAPNVGAPSGQTADDPNDLGVVYPLNLSFPKAGDYKIQIEYENGASIFRSNAGVTGFPFKINNLLTYRGALFNRSSSQVDTLTNAYYYFYDLKIKSLGCASPRVAVLAQTATKTTPVVSFLGNSSFCENDNLPLNAPANAGIYQWFLNDQPIAGATAATFAANVAGNYSVSTSVNNCLPTRSSPVALSTRKAEKPTVTLSGIELRSSALTNNQWFLNGLPIPNATNQTLTAFQSGSYSVRANANGCGELLSDEASVVITSVEEEALILQPTAIIYPNPADGFVTCEYQTPRLNVQNVVLSLYGITGHLLVEKKMRKMAKKFSAEIDIKNWQSGTFFAVIQEEGQPNRLVRQLVKP